MQMKKSEKFLVVYVREIKEQPGKYNVFFHDDSDIDPYRNEKPLGEDEAIKFAEELIKKEACVGSEIIIETRDGKARLRWENDRENYGK